MWICKQCGEKNNNSNRKCHGRNCKGTLEFDAKAKPIIGKERESTLDICPRCRRERLWYKAGRYRLKTLWQCTGCHKKAIQITPYEKKPEMEVVENAEIC